MGFGHPAEFRLKRKMLSAWKMALASDQIRRLTWKMAKSSRAGFGVEMWG